MKESRTLIKHTLVPKTILLAILSFHGNLLAAESYTKSGKEKESVHDTLARNLTAVSPSESAALLMILARPENRAEVSQFLNTPASAISRDDVERMLSKFHSPRGIAPII